MHEFKQDIKSIESPIFYRLSSANFSKMEYDDCNNKLKWEAHHLGYQMKGLGLHGRSSE
jgi:hypothetical protein